MSINLTESSRDRDGERAGNNCLERRPGRTIISPVVVPLLGHGSNPSSPCIAVRRATILPLPGGEGGSFRVPVTLLDILSPPPLSHHCLPSPKNYTHASIRAIKFHNATNPAIIFTFAPRIEPGLLKSFSYTFSSYTLEKSFVRITFAKSAETLSTIDRFPSSSLSIGISLSLSSFPCSKPPRLIDITSPPRVSKFPYSHRSMQRRILYVVRKCQTYALTFIVIPSGKYITVDLL